MLCISELTWIKLLRKLRIRSAENQYFRILVHLVDVTGQAGCGYALIAQCGGQQGMFFRKQVDAACLQKLLRIQYHNRNIGDFLELIA